jgi:hypothetical protein
MLTQLVQIVTALSLLCFEVFAENYLYSKRIIMKFALVIISIITVVRAGASLDASTRPVRFTNTTAELAVDSTFATKPLIWQLKRLQRSTSLKRRV